MSLLGQQRVSSTLHKRAALNLGRQIVETVSDEICLVGNER